MPNSTSCFGFNSVPFDTTSLFSNNFGNLNLGSASNIFASNANIPAVDFSNVDLNAMLGLSFSSSPFTGSLTGANFNTNAINIDSLYDNFTAELNANMQNKFLQMQQLFAGFGNFNISPSGINDTRTNEEKIKELTPQMQTKVNALLKYAEEQGLKVQITSGYRTREQQNYLLKTRPKYAAKDSLHCYGKAIDINIAGGSNADYKKLGDYAKSIGMRWGGDFSSVKERWHFDLGRA